MNWISIKRITNLGLTNFWRNRWLSLASTLVMTLTLLIISLFVVMTIVIGKTTDRIKAKMDITVYFKDSATTDEISDIQQKLAARSDVKEVRYISKEEALQIWNEKQKNQRIRELVTTDENPLPRSLAVKAIDPSNLNNIADYLSSDDFRSIIHKISYEENKQIIDKLLAITSFIKKLGTFFSIIFIIMSILVILNTIRLTIFTRKQEIEIMRLVGASDRFIKVPFIVEGALYGFLACILAMLLLWIGIGLITPLTNQYLGETVSQNMRNFFAGHFGLILLLQFLVGILVGIGCSLFSIRKYLKV
ncbi:MAG: Efflux ABC transporter [Berkelbacteria bacterium GW2011_GWB1_38_5]|uniref:Cell division protein FtsX n=2 Tax=Candidatus Berkelbacteria TaxID=1618330 RepID=A0A0G0KFW4_9BACT|nr:MAG: Efflux ABC transporter [Berkelbacteria bacterium GW2011_GWB1_38_5]